MRTFTSDIELATDIGTHTHTAFSIGNTETGDEVIKALETHVCAGFGGKKGMGFVTYASRYLSKKIRIRFSPI